jgi:hypothetical protein
MDLCIPWHHFGFLCGFSEENILDRLALRLHSRLDDMEPDPRVVTSTFRMKSKPSPTHLTLVAYPFADIDILWNRLTGASMENVGVDECCELMQRAPLLETLTLRDIRFYSATFPIPTTRVILPHLHSLELEGIGTEEVVGEILDSMCAPALKHWIHQPDGGPSPPSKMISFIEHSSFSLITFKVGGSDHVYNQLHTVLSRLSTLECLRLKFSSRPRRYYNQLPTDSFLNLLCVPSETSIFLPRLQDLELTFRPPFPWEWLPRIFTSISSARRSLRVKVGGHFGASMTDEAAERFLELIDEGFHLSILRHNGIDVLEEYRVKRQSCQTSL